MELKCIGSGSKGNAYALVEKDEILLLECGMPLITVKEAIGWKISNVVGCLISHIHKDHAGHVKEFLKAGIPVYTNAETAANIEKDWHERLYSLAEKKAEKIGGFKVIPFYVPHEDTPCYAYLIMHDSMGKMLFATDFSYIRYNFKNMGINHFLVEANYDKNSLNPEIPNYEHVMRGHASLDTCMDIISANKTPELRNVIMCHLGHSSSSRERFVESMEKITGFGVNVDCAASGLSIELCKDPF